MPYTDLELRRERDSRRFRRRSAERIARGLCPRCGKRAPAPGLGVCDPCAQHRRAADRVRAEQRRAAGIKRVRDPKARQAEHQRARTRAEERLAQGVCAKCGRHPPEPDRRLCASCGERRRRSERERYAKARAAGRPYGGKDPQTRRRQARRRGRTLQRARREAGLCLRCGACPPVESGSSCEPCLDTRRMSDRQTYAARRAAGLCGRCGTPTFEGAPLCGPCTVFEDRYRPKKNDANRARYAQRRARWVCTHCGQNPSFGASRCEACAKAAYERSEHVRGLPVWDLGCTVIERATGEHLGTWDRWEDAVLDLSFEGLSLDDVELVDERSPMHSMMGWS